MAAGILRPRRPRPGGTGRRRHVPGNIAARRWKDSLGVQALRATGARPSSRSTLVQTLFLRRLLRLGAVELGRRSDRQPALSTGTKRRLAPARAGAARVVPAALRPGEACSPWDWWKSWTGLRRRSTAWNATPSSPGSARARRCPYFYEPFLQAFDPELRKQLGVWYTPAEVVRYMVAPRGQGPEGRPGHPRRAGRRERVRPRPLLRHRCIPGRGTSAASPPTCRARDLGALTGERVKQAATQRVFGFEIMPAPVRRRPPAGRISPCRNWTRPLSDDGDERAGVFLTNALTGWEPTVQKPLPFPELEQERERADRVKQDTSPSWSSLATRPTTVSPAWRWTRNGRLSQAYRTTRQVRRPEGQGLNDLYVRFFRMAERRIAEKDRPGRGLLHLQLLMAGRVSPSPACGNAISKPSTPSALITCNGDKYQDSASTTPDGHTTDPSIFSIA